MANHGTGSSKFLSVNLNKSYGQRTSPGFGNAAHGSTRGGFNRSTGSGHSSGGGGYRGGMVVLGRGGSRSTLVGAQKSVSKLSVPPPLNLPSMKKEHERLDSVGSGSGAGRDVVSGVGPASFGIGWTKPSGVKGSVEVENGGDGSQVGGENGVARSGGSSVYMPPSARSSSGFFTSEDARYSGVAQKVERAAVLRGEDFPSLQQAVTVTLPVVNGGGGHNKQRDGGKQNQKLSEEVKSAPVVEMVGSPSVGSTVEKEAKKVEKKVEYLPGPLPDVRLNHTSDWGDDERDTRHSFLAEREKDGDNGFVRDEFSWNKNFDFPRVGVMPRKPIREPPLREVVKLNPYVRDVRTPPSREGQDGATWRGTRQAEEEYGSRYCNVMDRNVTGGCSFAMNRDSNNYGQTHYQAGNRSGDSYNGRRYGGVEQSKRYTDEFFQQRSRPTKAFSYGNKGLSVSEPILDFGREKRLVSGKQYAEDPFNDDGSDPLTGSFMGVLKKKKDVLKQADFHDPVRESFEAELERVQKIQEQERQRAIDEQARAMEFVRKEEEERQRVVREVEECQRRLEKEAREAAWRAEQENLESMRKIEEQKNAREEERRRIDFEEERRKEAARQKLLELEARIAARKQVESAAKDDKVKDVVHWEYGEKMVERITSSASSDSSGVNRSVEMGSAQNHYVRDVDSAFQERVKPLIPWKRDMFESGNTHSFFSREPENNEYCNTRQDIFGASRKEFFGSPGVHSIRPFSNGGIPEPHPADEFHHPRGPQGWNYPGDGDHYSRSSEFNPEFHDMGWGQNRSRGGSHAYSDRQYDNSETDGFPSFGISRYSMRQPRVLPPPPVSSMHKNTFRPEIERPRASAGLDNELRYNTSSRSNEPIIRDGSFDDNYEEQQLLNTHGDNTNSHDETVERASTPRCDSQSSLSVSSPPSSPSHLSNDELEELLLVVPSSVQKEELVLSENGNKTAAISGYASSEDDEEWNTENVKDLPEQEEYDEEEEGYQEEDELHDENIDLTQELEALNRDEKDTSGGMITEVGVPTSGDMKSKSMDGDMTVRTQQASSDTSEEPRTLDAAQNPIQSDHKTPTPSGSVESVSEIILEAAEPLSDLATKPGTGTISHNLDGADVAISSSLPTPIISTTASTSQNQGEVPVKLQFGLFSGPSLIPSPIQAIQIGSIQMPLHLHHQVGLSPHQVHQQSPFFQFGQLRYTSPITQGLLPLTPHQPMSFVQPPLRANYSIYHKQDAFNQEQVVKDAVAPVSMDNHSDHSRQKRSHSSESKIPFESSSQIDQGQRYMNMRRNYRPNLPNEHDDSQFTARAPGSVSGNRRRRYIYAVKNSGSRSSGPHPESSQTDYNVYRQRPRQRVQRTEFRVRENVDNRYKERLSSSERVRSNSMNSHIAYESKTEKVIVKEVPVKKMTSASVEMSLSEVNIDAPLQSGFVCVFEQPGIEAPSDEDDFIEVRSKRQMLNDRREQRERENKALAAKALKENRKLRVVRQSNIVSANSSKISSSSETANRSRFKSGIAGVERGLNRAEVSQNTTNAVVLQPLAPIGTPSTNLDSNSTKVLPGGRKLGQALPYENHDVALAGARASMGPWENTRTNQQVISLTQTQLDEAMNPAKFETQISSVSGLITAVMDSNIAPSLSILAHASSSPINSLLAEEKIQFGAVTFPTIIPFGSHPILNGNANDQKLPSLETGCSLFFEKEKHHNDNCSQIEDTEAEAAAAASAIAVAAISNDDVVGNVSVSESKSFGVADIEGGQGNIVSESRGEESSLAVSLPADLETPTLSLWPSLTSPQHSSNQMLSHFPEGPPPAHFPCYEMNHPMLGGPIFAFGLQDEAAETNPQSQKSSSGPSGAWHSGVDSFYGPPAGFAGSFISPPGGIPGSPHMVVYNHFTPVGQFGQVGLSFMGTTYVPSGKQQPDWKHNPTSLLSSTGGDGNINDNSASMQQQRNSSTMPPIQHLAPGSPLLPPLAMFDMSPFQSSADLQARWSQHLPTMPLHSLPLSKLLQQPLENGTVSSLSLSQGMSVDHQSTGIRLHEPRSSAPLDNAIQLPHELGLVDSPSSRIPRTQPYNSTSGNNSIGVGHPGIINNSFRNAVVSSVGNIKNFSNISNNNQVMGSGLKNRSNSVQQQYFQRAGYTDQRAGEWASHHRRAGYHGRNNHLGADKKVNSAKVKQIYVPKSNVSGNSSAF